MAKFTVNGKVVATWDGLDIELVGTGWLAEAATKDEAIAILRRHYKKHVEQRERLTMVITIKAKAPGVWHVYRSEGLVTNRAAGLIRRQGTICTYYFHRDGDHEANFADRHEITSCPAKWPSVVKGIIRREQARV